MESVFINKTLSKFYWVVAAISCVICGYQNLEYYNLGLIDGAIAFFKDIHANRASQSIGYDILLMYLMSIGWMWKLRQKTGTISFICCLVLSTTIAMSVGFPMFLAIASKKSGDLILQS